MTHERLLEILNKQMWKVAYNTLIYNESDRIITATKSTFVVVVASSPSVTVLLVHCLQVISIPIFTNILLNLNSGFAFFSQ